MDAKLYDQTEDKRSISDQMFLSNVCSFGSIVEKNNKKS